MKYFIGDMKLGGISSSVDLHPNEVVEEIRFMINRQTNILRELAKLTSNDELYIIGDLTVLSSDWEYALQLLDLIKFTTGVKIYHITTRYQNITSIHPFGDSNFESYLRVFDNSQPYSQIHVGEQKVLINVYPYPAENVLWGTASFQLPRMNYPLLFSTDPDDFEKVWPNDTYNVSWDTQRRLVSETDILYWLDNPITETDRTDTRDPNCVKNWPDCYSGGYNPACCRFPKSCSA